MEGTNARYIDHLSEPVSLVTVDVSFISLKVLLPVIRDWFQSRDNASSQGKGLEERGNVIALIKPQFEAGREQASKGEGVIRDPAVHREVLLEVLGFSIQQGFEILGLIRSPLLGPKGNVEFLALLALTTQTPNLLQQKGLRELITEVVLLPVVESE